MNYPNPEEEQNLWGDSVDTFTSDGVNDEGEFVRSYKTLEDAKRGAAHRCGGYGFNRDTILKKEAYCGKTAQEVLEKLKKE